MSARDYESMRKELIARIPALTDRWTDFNPTDPGMVLLELFCGVADMLFKYIDEQTAEVLLGFMNVVNFGLHWATIRNP